MLDSLKDIIRKSSIHACLINTGGCNGCDIEIVALLSPRYDLEQYGIYFHNNPREADVILVTGPVAEQWKEHLQRVYAKVPNPKIVVAIGSMPSFRSCLQSGRQWNLPSTQRIHTGGCMQFRDVHHDQQKYYRHFWQLDQMQ